MIGLILGFVFGVPIGAAGFWILTHERHRQREREAWRLGKLRGERNLLKRFIHALENADDMDHRDADDLAQRYLGNIEPAPGETPYDYLARLRVEQVIFQVRYPNWKGEHASS